MRWCSDASRPSFAAAGAWPTESAASGKLAAVRVSAKVDYAVRAAVELAAAPDDTPMKGDRIADAQNVPLKFLENILAELRRAGIVGSQRGAEGGYWLAKKPASVSI